MAIRNCALLTKSELAEAPFRSLQEVDDYLKKNVKQKLDELDALLRQYQLQFSRTEVKSAFEFRIGPSPANKTPGGKTFKVEKLDKIVIPKLTAMRQHFSVVEELSDQVDSLDTYYNAIAIKFKGVRGAADTLKNIRAMQRSAETKLDKALAFLKTIGDKYAPTQFKALVEKTMSVVEDGIDYKDYSNSLYASETDKEQLSFTYYVKIRGLMDDTGSVYPYFFLVFTCVLKQSDEKNKLQPMYWVTVMHEFSPPGKFIKGRQVGSAAEAATALGMLLDLENIGSTVGLMPHNLDPSKLVPGKFKEASLITKIDVDTSSLTFHLLKGTKGDVFNAVVQSLYLSVKGMMSHIPKAKIKAKLDRSEGNPTVKFSLTNLAQSDKISTSDIDFLQEHFNLDDAKIRKIVQVINHD